MHVLRQCPHLRPAVDDVNLMQRDHVHHLLALLKLALRALHKLCGGACGEEEGAAVRGQDAVVASAAWCGACAVSLLAGLKSGWRMCCLTCAALCTAACLRN